MRKFVFGVALLTGMVTCTTLADTDKQKLGQDIYTTYCSACHMTGVAQAPKAHDTAAWQQRFDAALAIVTKNNPKAKDDELKNKALDYLVSSVKNGKNAMPPGGTCPNKNPGDACQNDEAYKAAIEYMKSGENHH